jgi:hypothetical protein
MVLNVNCVIAQELTMGINDAAMKHKSWDQMPTGLAPEDALPIYSVEHDDRAMAVFTISTTATDDGMLVALGKTSRISCGCSCRDPSGALAIWIMGVGETAGWWNEESLLQPAIMPDNLVIHRAANQLIMQHGERASTVAPEQSNAAIEAGRVQITSFGEAFGGQSESWKALAPSPGEAIN